MINEIKEFLQNYSPFINIITFSAGLVLGNKYAIGRDRRKEFNDAAMPIRRKLQSQIRSLNERNDPQISNRVTLSEIDQLIDVSHKWKKNSILTASSVYQEALADCGGVDDDGFYVCHSPEKLTIASEKLINFTKRK